MIKAPWLVNGGDGASSRRTLGVVLTPPSATAEGACGCPCPSSFTSAAPATAPWLGRAVAAAAAAAAVGAAADGDPPSSLMPPPTRNPLFLTCAAGTAYHCLPPLPAATACEVAAAGLNAPVRPRARRGPLPPPPRPAAAAHATRPRHAYAVDGRHGTGNDAPCPPFTSHGASIILLDCLIGRQHPGGGPRERGARRGGGGQAGQHLQRFRRGLRCLLGCARRRRG
jgi:hypothetical protein